MDDEPESAQRIARLTPLADVLARIVALVNPVAPQVARIADAQGFVLAADVVAATGAPAVARALRDGFALASEGTADAGGYAPVSLATPPVRVNAGEAMPAGTDAVVPLDAVTMRDNACEVLAQVAPGEGVLPAAGDVRAGTILRRAGERLRGIDVAALSAAGIGDVSIRAPRLHLIGARRADDVILDAIASLVARGLASEGALLSDAGGRDLAAVLGSTDADATIVIGGTGSGKQDRSVRTLARLGRVEVHGVAISPGETAAFGFVGARPVLVLPGRLDAALAAWLLLGRPVLTRLTGCVEVPPSTSARLARKVASPLGLTEVAPVRMRDGRAEPIASGYVPLAALAQSDGWILIAAESEGYPPGTEVMIQAWP